jgi:cytochrome c biogenesis protein CcdA
MKKLVSNLNPFILLLVPVLFALALGVSYQFEQARHFSENSSLSSVKQTTSLFTKGINLIQTVCAVTKEVTW